MLTHFSKYFGIVTKIYLQLNTARLPIYVVLVSTYKTVKLSQYVFRPVVRRVAGGGKVTTSFGRNRLK